MTSSSYDLVIVGGGLGGSTLAKVMAEHGAHVLVIEREREFRDRVRGEAVSPWGAAEAKGLGVYDLLLDRCAFERRWALGLGRDRDLVMTTPQKLPLLTFYHPEMQEVILEAATRAGAEIRRGSAVSSVVGGTPAEVWFESDSKTEHVQARLVVGADGRGSSIRKRGNFNVRQDAQRMLIAGVLLEDLQGLRAEACYFVINPEVGQISFLVGQRPGSARAYVGYRVESDFRLGRESLQRLIEESVRCGIPADVFARAKIAGPLATFSGADSWVEHPYADGIALIGDAASTSDPTWGQGLSLTLRDVRVLRDVLLLGNDWDSAGHAYAAEHDGYYRKVHAYEDLLTEFFFGTSAEAHARRAKAMPLIGEDPTRVPDHVFSGPDLPLDETVEARFFGEA
jgi:menaquinone-9 beta-reductase